MSPPGLLLVANYDNDVGYAWNNIYRLFNAIGRAFTARGVQPCVSFPCIEGPLTVLDREVPWETFTFDPHRPTTASLAAARPLFRSHNIRWVYLTDQRPTRWDYAVMRRWGVRRIVIHSRISVPDPNAAKPTRGVRRFIKTGIAHLPLANANRVYAVSDFVRDRLIVRGCLPAARVKTILNGIEVDRWACEEPAATRTEVVFFASARAAAYKGIPILIDAASLLRSKHAIDGFRVRFAGDGPDLGSFKHLVDSKGLGGHFEFLGRLSDTRHEVCGADVVVVPSTYGDACPSTVSEGLASGRAVIATRAGGIPQLVGDPANALLVPPGDADALAAAMATLVRQPERRRQLGANGRRRAHAALRQDVYHAAVVASLMEDFAIDRIRAGAP